MVNKDYRWYVIKTRPRHEMAAIAYLTRAGVTCFCPISRVVRQRSDRKAVITVPLFSMYAFVRISCIEYMLVLECPHVLGYVKRGGFPDFVPENQIHGLKKMKGDQENYSVTNRIIRNGDPVLINQGAFKGMEAVVRQVSSYREAFLNFDATGYAIRIPINYVEPIQNLQSV